MKLTNFKLNKKAIATLSSVALVFSMLGNTSIKSNAKATLKYEFVKVDDENTNSQYQGKMIAGYVSPDGDYWVSEECYLEYNSDKSLTKYVVGYTSSVVGVSYGEDGRKMPKYLEAPVYSAYSSEIDMDLEEIEAPKVLEKHK